MSIEQLQAEVVAELQRDRQSMAKRRKAIADVAKALARGKSSKLPRLHSRSSAWFATDQGHARKQGAVKIQVLGVNVGSLVLNRRSGEYEFRPDGRKFPRFADTRWHWSGKRDAAAIRQFLRDCRTHPMADPENERELQWQLAGAMKTSTVAEFRHLQPVLWKGNFTEIGVAVNRFGKAGTGNIDILARRGKGNNRGLLVFEIKGPGDDDVESALKQALRYAIGLYMEVGTSDDPDNLKNYQTVFGCHPSKRVPAIGAVIAMPDTPAVTRALPALLKEYDVSTSNTCGVDRIGVLLHRGSPGELRWRWYKDPR